MEQPKFNPNNPEYKKIEDLPENQKEKFADFDDGFIEKEALKAWEFWEEEAKKANDGRSIFRKVLNIDKKMAIDLIHQEANILNDIFNEEKRLANEKQNKIIEAKSEIEKLNDIIEQWMEAILDRLKPWINNSEISAVISEDRSGRLPAEIILTALNKIYEEQGCRHIALIPIDTGREIDYWGNKSSNSEELDRSEIKNEFVKLINNGEVEKSLLYVTEYIAEGDTIRRALSAITSAIEESEKNVQGKSVNHGQGKTRKISQTGIIVAPLGGFHSNNQQKVYAAIAGSQGKRQDYYHDYVDLNKMKADSNDQIDIFRKFSGLDKKTPLTEDELMVRKNFIDTFSDKFVEMYKGAK